MLHFTWDFLSLVTGCARVLGLLRRMATNRVA